MVQKVIVQSLNTHSQMQFYGVTACHKSKIRNHFDMDDDIKQKLSECDSIISSLMQSSHKNKIEETQLLLKDNVSIISRKNMMYSNSKQSNIRVIKN
jgi:hypothetical protein